MGYSFVDASKVKDMRLRSLLTIGSISALVVGVAIAAYSLTAIDHLSSVDTTNTYVEVPMTTDSTHLSTIWTQPITPHMGQLLGTLTIPRLNKSIPYYEGTSNTELRKGAGHFVQSVLPGLNDNSVISGHRDGVFTQFGSLQKGDALLVTTSYGKFTYTIISFRIVAADDRTVIVPTMQATLTLTTCYPFYYIGNAPKRFVVNALLTSQSKVAA